MRWPVCIVVAVACAASGPALALPNGAPWGSANPAVEPNCSSCHFDGEAVKDSSEIALKGLPETITAGETYALKLYFLRQHDGVTGFLVSASSGEFSAVHPDLEFRGLEIRSISPSVDAAAEWKFKWSAPAVLPESLIFHFGVNAADNDASPFGDEIHFKAFEVEQK